MAARKTRSNRRQSRKQKQSRKQQEGGARRKSHKVGSKASSWAAAVGKIYRELKAKNPATKLGDAMKEASKRRKAGKL